MNILLQRARGLAPYGFVLFVLVSTYFGMWIGADDTNERLMWDGMPPSSIIAFFDRTSQEWLFLFFGLQILTLGITFLGHRPWWIAGMAALALFCATPYLTAYWLILPGFGPETPLSGGSEALKEHQFVLTAMVFIGGVLMTLALRGLLVLFDRKFMLWYREAPAQPGS